MGRLRAAGYAPEQAVQLMGSALIQELWLSTSKQQPRVRDALLLLDRALKGAWLAREEETRAGGTDGSKLQDAMAILADIAVFLESRPQPEEARGDPGSTATMTPEPAVRAQS